ncbi:DNA polymerase IV [Sporolactobacillus sp. CPB3-1]|uniref:DNA polymerase IV n=1 Tax=Sporolactobacillus mangiferae TaxID=2940498 RepID=A0ABT0MC94_9BACL|nr:DNA polymerase IV [Sporolactobacillus mangiferae]MCL1631894.1 DNA polymerase IV [Sporolactobacillus mangiferae]
MANARVIFHIDMNSFYASVEIANHPELKGCPLAIAGKTEERHGIIVTSSYEARKFGVRTTMTVREAKKRCPELIVRHPDFTLYRQTSDRLFAMLKEYTPIIEKASIDEGYLDMSMLRHVHPPTLARSIQNRIARELHLPCSIGIAPNKFLAKMASNIKKPLGITVIRKRELAQCLWLLPIGKMHGVGPKTEQKFISFGIRTIGDLARQDQAFIGQQFGTNGRRLFAFANGCDDRPVDPEAWDRYKSIGHSMTLPRDTHEMKEILSTFHQLAAKLAAQLKKEHVVSYELIVVIRYHDLHTVTRHQKTVQPLQSPADIERFSLSVFQKNWHGEDIRLLGVTLTSFQSMSDSTKQLDLFSYQRDAQNEPLIDLMNKINEQFGNGTILPANRLLKTMKSNDADH